MGELFLLRHGQTEWSATGRHTGRTDVPLTPEGEEEAKAWAPLLAGRGFALVLASTLQRAARTAALAGVSVTSYDDDLMEWDYGAAEGLTTAELRTDHPGWDVWADGPAGGETLAGVGARAERVLERVAGVLEAGDVLLAGHGHALRILAARWLGLPPSAGALLALDSGRLCVLSHERERRVLRGWGLTPADPL